MPTDLPLRNPTNADDRLCPQALPRVQRWIVLGIWIGLLLFGTVALWPVYSFNRGPWPIVFFGAWFAQAGLLAVWAGFAQQPLTVRLPWAIGLAAVLTLSSLWAAGRGYHFGPPSDRMLVVSDQMIVPFLPVLFLVLLPPLPLVRWLLGWRIGLCEEHDASVPCTTTQFSLRQLLIWTGATALLLAWAKCVVPAQMTELWHAYTYDARGAGIFLAILCLPILIPSVGLVLARTNRVRFALGTIASIILVTLFFYGSSDSPGDCHPALTFFSFSWSEDSPSQECSLPLIGGGFLGVLFGTLLVLRFCGYRLLRRKEERLAAVSLAVTDAAMPTCEVSAPMVQHPRMWKTPFPYLVAAMLLIGLMLCWLAWEPELQRREIALNRSWEAVGASPSINEGAVTSIRFDQSPVPEAGLRKLQELRSSPTFQVLCLEGKELANDQMHYLQGLAGLRLLFLTDTPLTDAGLAQLDDLESLQVLRLQNTRITDEGLKYLQRFENLEDLDLQGTPITGVGFAHLTGLPKLKTLRLTKTQMTDEGLAHLQRFENLEDLDLQDTPITGIGFAHLTGLPKLKTLRLNKTQMTDEGLAHLQRFENLEDLQLQGTPITGVGFARLTGLPRLQHLRLAQTQLTDEGLAHLKRFENLAGLTLVDTRITRAGLPHLAGLSKLQGLELTNTLIDDESLAHLTSLEALEILWLNGTRITDAGLAQLTSLKGLWVLNLANTQITDAGVKHLQQLENLKMLSLGGTRITDAGLAQLQSLQKLEYLGVYGTQVTDRGIEGFQKALPDCHIGNEPASP